MNAAADADRARQMIEAVHHACAAGDLDAAAAMLYNHIYHGPNAYFTHVLGAYDAMLSTLTDFYPLRELTLDPNLDNPSARRWILHETAACLQVLGRLSLAAELGARAAAAAIGAGDLHNAAITYHNLAETRLAAGALASCREVTLEAQRIAIQAEELEDQLVAWTLLGCLNDLAEQHNHAAENFRSALEIAVAHTSVPLLYSLSGVRYATHLAAIGHVDEAVAVAQSNLEFCLEQGWQSDAALCLAQLAAIGSDHIAEALRRADDAVRMARTIGAKHTLAVALLSRAELAVRSDRPHGARDDLTEVLAIAQQAGYRILEADARIALSVVRRAQREIVAARAEAELAEQLSRQLGYVHGAHRAREILDRTIDR